MIISSDVESQAVTDFDFTFTNGLFMTVSINEEQGDQVDFDTHPLTAMFHLAEKPSVADPDTTLPAEDITIFMGHVLSIQKRKRLFQPITQDQRSDLKNIYAKMSKAVN